MAEVILKHIQTKQDVSSADLATLLLALVEHVKTANQRLERIEERLGGQDARITKLEEVR